MDVQSAQQAKTLKDIVKIIAAIVDVFILVDSSGSVGESRYELMRSCVRQLVYMLPFDADASPPPTRLGVLQFDTQVYAELLLETNIDSINCAISAMKYRKGGTNSQLALKTSYDLLMQHTISGRNKVVFLITDGDVCNAHSQAAKMKNEGVLLVCILIGSSQSQLLQLQTVASPGCALLFNSFEEMQKVFAAVTTKASDAPAILIKTRGSKTATFEFVSKTGCDCYELEFFDPDTNRWAKKLDTDGRTCYAKNLKPATIYSVRACSISNLIKSPYSAELKFRTLIGSPLSDVLVDPSQLKAAHAKLKDRLNQYRHQRKKGNLSHLNILLMGRIGNGKSALMNTINSSLKGFWSQVSVAKNSIQTVTLRLKKWKVVDTICIWDIYGWTENTKSFLELSAILNGHLVNNFKEGDELSGANYLPNPTLQDKVHAVVIVCEAGAVHSVSEMERLREFFDALTDKGLQPVIALTKLDTLHDAELDTHPERIYDSGVVDITLNTFAKNTNIAASNIMPAINYDGQFDDPHLVKEFLSMRVVEKAISQAESFIEQSLHSMSDVDIPLSPAPSSPVCPIPTSPSSGHNSCSKCRQPLESAFKLCPYCQTPVKTKPKPAANLCRNPACSNPIDANWKACPFCGTTQTPSCSSCQKELHTGWAVCPFCGTNVSA
jgi:uncharacterized protein YegL/GTP-binding protein EngB required for normal cell division/uncharacterized Zn-finger protein